MAQKDISEKLLEDYNDVFADIVNVLLFNGKEVIHPDELEEANVISQYKADDGAMHEQERDVAKIWKRGGIRIAMYGLENQTSVDKYMPLRVINYDGAAYRSQLLSKENDLKYPVVTLVLYYGEECWRGPKSLYEALDIPEEVRAFISDYKINVYEISYLTDEQLKMFKSDFGILADFFVNKRRNKDYIPKDSRKFKHVDAMLKFLSVMLKAQADEINFSRMAKGEMTMDAYLERLVNKGRKEGIKEGRKEGIEKAYHDIVENMLREGFTDGQIISACNITNEQLAEIKNEILTAV